MKLFYAIILIITLIPYSLHAEEEKLRTVTVQGEAQQDFSPDIAKFSVDIIGQAPTSDEAKRIHDTMLKSLTELTKKHHIEDKDLSTSFSSVNPNYEYPNGKRKFTNYTAHTQINITLRNLKMVGNLQDDLISSGFDNFKGPTYTLDKLFTYNNKILTEAVDNALEKASRIAKRLNETIDKPIDITEDNALSAQPVRYAKSMMTSEATSDYAVQPSGVITIKSAVVATFSLK